MNAQPSWFSDDKGRRQEDPGRLAYVQVGRATIGAGGQPCTHRSPGRCSPTFCVSGFSDTDVKTGQCKPMLSRRVGTTLTSARTVHTVHCPTTCCGPTGNPGAGGRALSAHRWLRLPSRCPMLPPRSAIALAAQSTCVRSISKCLMCQQARPSSSPRPPVTSARPGRCGRQGLHGSLQ